MGLGSGRIPRLPHGTFRCVAGGVSLEPVPLGQGPHFGGHPGIFYPNTPMQINDPERTRQAAPELRLDAPGADDFTEHPLSMNGEAPAGKSVRNGKGAPAAPSFSCSTSCPLSHVPQKAWLHLFRVPFRKRHPVIFWGLLILLLGGIAAFMVSLATGLGSERIALVRVTGPIMDIDAQLRWIDKLGRMPGVKGVLVRVDSPGGGAAASQELYEALARLGKDKPIAVSMGSIAASGGLMVSMAGKRVFANASTVTGSIGVRMDIPQIRGLLDKLGLGRQTLTTAPYKDAGSMLEPLTAEEKAYFQGVLKDMHEQFVDIVAQGRHMDRARAARLATGKIFTGREAVELGLVDELGGQQAAHRWLADVCKVPVDQPLLTPPSEDEWWEKSLKTWFGLDADALLGRETPAFLYSF